LLAIFAVTAGSRTTTQRIAEVLIDSSGRIAEQAEPPVEWFRRTIAAKELPHLHRALPALVEVDGTSGSSWSCSSTASERAGGAPSGRRPRAAVTRCAASCAGGYDPARPG
jgi:hypothetical protein